MACTGATAGAAPSRVVAVGHDDGALMRVKAPKGFGEDIKRVLSEFEGDVEGAGKSVAKINGWSRLQPLCRRESWPRWCKCILRRRIFLVGLLP